MTLGTRTPSKSTVSSGKHAISIGREGYRQWQKSVEVIPGSILWLSYARLIPSELTPENTLGLSSLSSTAVSPDKKWLAVKENVTTPSIRLVDISQDSVKTSELMLPATSFTAAAAGKTHAFSVENWDPTSRYVLVKHTYNDSAVEWLIADTQNIAATKNVTTLLDINASSIMFSGNNTKIIYAQIGGDIRKIDLDAATLSRPLVTNVAEFSLFDKTTITYTTQLDPITKVRSVGYFKDGSEKPVVVRSYTDDGNASLHLVIGRYFNETYVATSYGDAVEIFKGNLPVTEIDRTKTTPHATFTLPGGVQYFTLAADGRFIVAQQGPTYVTYDAELNKTTGTTLKGTTDVTRKLQWLDDYTLLSDRDGMVRMYEFDGANQHDIMPVTAGFTASISPNGKYLYGFVKTSDGQYQLKRVRLILS
jgi:hypothetical protein